MSHRNDYECCTVYYFAGQTALADMVTGYLSAQDRFGFTLGGR